MTVDKLNEANALYAQIEKTKEVKAMLETEGTAIVSEADNKKITIDDVELRKRLVDAVEGLLTALEDEFKWLRCYD